MKRIRLLILAGAVAVALPFGSRCGRYRNDEFGDIHRNE